MSKGNYGYCALCGKYKRLTFEHIPPRAAFNSSPRKTVTGEAVMRTVSAGRKPWELEGLPYENQQRGLGRVSLCSDCNSLTGSLYGDEYKKMAFAIASLLQQTKAKPNSSVHVNIEKVRLLAFFKQVCSMFCSINVGIKDMDKLGAFVLDKDSHDFPKERFQIGMYLLAGGFGRQIPLTVMCYPCNGKTKIEAVSEIASYPLGFILFFDPDEHTGKTCLDITSFADYEYDALYDLEMIVPVYECNIMFPTDFRTKAEFSTRSE